VIRVWELRCESLLAGGLGTLPLALLTDDAQPTLRGVVERMQRRFRDEAVPERIAGGVMTAAYVLLGLRQDQETLDRVFEGVTMLESSTGYQAIYTRGRLQERRANLRRIASQRFGAPGPETEAVLASITDGDRLERMIDRLLNATDWNDLMNTP
jgi:hypothetical protein